MGIKSRIKKRAGDWFTSRVTVVPQRRGDVAVVRVDFFGGVAVELRRAHALRLADALVDAAETFERGSHV